MFSHTATRKILDRYSYLQSASTHVHLLQVSSEPFETGSHVFWAEGLDDAAILPHIKREPATKSKLRAFFLDYVEVAPNEPTFDLRIRLDTLECLCQCLRISPLVLEDLMDRNPGARLGQASFVHPGEGEKTDTIESVYQYMNSWTRLHRGWFCYDSASALSTYVLWNCPEFTRRGIVSCAQEDPLSFVTCPLMLDALIARECADFFRSISSGPIRTLLHWENDSGQGISLQAIAHIPNGTEVLHYLSRDLQIIGGDLTNFDEGLMFLIELDNMCRSPGTTRTSPSAIEALIYFLSRNRISKRFVEHCNERAQLMINLLFNMGTQVDSRTHMEIANLTSKIAVDAQRDSSSMITIAAVTMVFLPGTFISAVFSMAFFDASTDSEGKATLEVSPLLWYYPAITIPLTIVVLIVWEIWRRKRQAERAPKHPSEAKALSAGKH